MSKDVYCPIEQLSSARAVNMQTILNLFNANAGLIRKTAARYSRIDTAIGFDDLMQEAFFAVMDAVKSYQPERGGWARVLIWCLQKSFRAMVRRAGRELSLDAPLRDGEDETMLDQIASTETADGKTICADFKTSVHALISQRVDERTAKIIYACDLGGQSLRDYCAAAGLSYTAAAQKRRLALLTLARSRAAKQLYCDALELGSKTFYKNSAETVAFIHLGEIEKRKDKKKNGKVV